MTIPYPHIPPVIVSIGPLAVRWYGVMYGVGYVLGYRLARTRTARAILPIDREDLDSWIGYLVVGMLVGARLVYATVYDRPAFARVQRCELAVSRLDVAHCDRHHVVLAMRQKS